MSRTLVVALLVALHAVRALGQAQPAPPDNWQTVFFDSPAVALPLLTAAAVKHSAQLKAMETEKAISQQELILTKKSILGAVGAGASYSYGNLAGVAIADPTNPNQFTTYNSSRYSTGLSLSLPLDRVVARGNMIQKDKLNYQRLEQLRQDREDQLRQLTIERYQGVLLARKILTIRQEASVTARTTYQLSEKQFRQGQLTLPDFSQASNLLTEVALAETTARNQYDMAFMLLEELVGAKISSLMTATQ